eukprot:9242430-Pyramimonas_sp.AAC.2
MGRAPHNKHKGTKTLKACVILFSCDVLRRRTVCTVDEDRSCVTTRALIDVPEPETYPWNVLCLECDYLSNWRWPQRSTHAAFCQCACVHACANVSSSDIA